MSRKWKIILLVMIGAAIDQGIHLTGSERLDSIVTIGLITVSAVLRLEDTK